MNAIRKPIVKVINCRELIGWACEGDRHGTDHVDRLDLRKRGMSQRGNSTVKGIGKFKGSCMTFVFKRVYHSWFIDNL